MSRLGASPPPVCICGHDIDAHTYGPWAGRCGECSCPWFELDADQ